jgi:hypothetical protein
MVVCWLTEFKNPRNLLLCCLYDESDDNFVAVAAVVYAWTQFFLVDWDHLLVNASDVLSGHKPCHFFGLVQVMGSYDHPVIHESQLMQNARQKEQTD